MFKGWGFEYFKIDGQPIVIDEYGKTKEFQLGAVGKDLPEENLEHLKEASFKKRKRGLTAQGELRRKA